MEDLDPVDPNGRPPTTGATVCAGARHRRDLWPVPVLVAQPVGDALPGGANVKLSKVLPDRIVIENNGRYELLWLYDETARAKPAPAPVTEPRPMRSSAKISQNVAQRFVNDKNLSAESLADVVKISMKRDGADVIGFEVRPGRDRDVFDNLGLQSGDVITAVNGTKLSDAATAVDIARTVRG